MDIIKEIIIFFKHKFYFIKGLFRKSKIVLIGEIDIDSGLCWIGDPCYIIHTEDKAKTLGKNWNEFCSFLIDPISTQFNYEAGHSGLGICTATGFGDGSYPVYAKIVKYKEFGWRIKKVWIRYI